VPQAQVSLSKGGKGSLLRERKGFYSVGREERKLSKSPHAIINIMEVGDIRFYKERWRAVEEIERWGITRYGSIERILILLGIKKDNGVDKMQIILRWAKIKDLFEQGKLKKSQ
jgi:hypothetical protein